MGEKIYSIRILYSEKKDVEIINSILGVESSDDNSWIFKVIEEADDEYVDFFKISRKILEGKLKKLEEIGFPSEQISIWVLYGYIDQCNLQFFPDDLSFLSENGISLCISCWEK